jgi:hypothetical protein
MSKVDTIDVSNLGEYQSACAKFGATAYFRGQVNDYPQILPSLFRPGAISDDTFENLIVGLYLDCYNIADWHLMQEEQRQEFEDSFNPIGPIVNLFPHGRKDD